MEKYTSDVPMAFWEESGQKTVSTITIHYISEGSIYINM